MKRYVYAYISFFDKELELDLITSEKSAFEVAKEMFSGLGYEVYDDVTTIEQLKGLAFDCESMLNIVEI